MSEPDFEKMATEHLGLFAYNTTDEVFAKVVALVTKVYRLGLAARPAADEKTVAMALCRVVCDDASNDESAACVDCDMWRDYKSMARAAIAAMEGNDAHEG